MSASTGVVGLLRSRAGLAVLALAALVVFSGALDYLSDKAFYPWALVKPGLMTSWRGSLTAGNGDRLTVSVQLQRARGSRGRRACAKCNQLEGVAVTCNAKGYRRTYRVAGSPKDRRGTALLIGAAPNVTPPPDGLELDVLKGSWDGAGVLEMMADFHWRRGQSAISSSDDPATQPVPIRLTPLENATTRACGE